MAKNAVGEETDTLLLRPPVDVIKHLEDAAKGASRRLSRNQVAVEVIEQYLPLWLELERRRAAGLKGQYERSLEVEQDKTVVTEFVEPGQALPPPSPMLRFPVHAGGKRKPVPCVWCGKTSPGGICEDHVKELTASPKMAEAALNDLPYGTIELNEEGTILAYNKAEEELSRISHRKTIGRNFFTDIAKCTAVSDFHSRYDAFLVSGTAASEEFSFTYDFPRGRSVDVLIRFVRVDEHRALVLTRKAGRGQKRRRGDEDEGDEES